MRIKAKNILVFCAFVIFCSGVFSYAASPKPVNTAQKQDKSTSKQELVKLYEKLIKLRENAVEQKKKLIELGQASNVALAEVEAKAIEASIQLAEFLGKKENIIEGLQKLEQNLKQIRAQMEKEVDAGQRPVNGLDDIDEKLLEIQIRLAKIQLEKDKIAKAKNSEVELEFRLETANKINDIKMKNDALSSIAAIAARSGQVEIMKEILGQINDIPLKDHTIRACAIQLVQANKTKDAIELVYNLINDIQIKNEILLHISTMDYEWSK